MSLEDKIVAAVNTYIGAFEKNDLEGIMDLYADECTLEDPIGSGIKEGKAAVREFYQGATQSKIKLELEADIRVTGNYAAFAFVGTMDTGDGVLTFRPIDTMEFNDDGKIVAMRAYFGARNTSKS